MRNPTFLKAFLLLLIAITSAKVNAQNAQAETPSPSPSPESEEVLKRREAKTIAELERDIAKAKKDKLDAEFPKPTSTPLEGKTELDSGVKLESEMLAYRAMSNAAAQIVADMKTNAATISALAVHNDRDLKALMGYMVISSQIDLMKQEYAKSIEVGAAAPGAQRLGQAKIGPLGVALPVAQSFLGSFIDLIALLRTDTSIKGMDFNIEESVLVSEVFREIRASGGYGPGTELFYPAVFPPHITEDRQFFILARIQELYLIRERAAKLVTEITETEKAIDDTKTEIKGAEKKLKDDKDKVALLDKELERLQKIYWRWPSSRIAERIEEVTGQITNLRDEIQKLPIVIKENKAKLGDLNQRLSDRYGQILPLVDTNDTVAAVDVAIQKIAAAEALLGRSFSTTELGLFLTEFDEATKKALIQASETHLGRKLTATEKVQLLTPLSEPEQNALHKIYTGQIAQGVAVTRATLIALSPAQKTDPLTQAAQFSLLSELEQAALQEQKKEKLTQLRALNDQFDKLKDELIKVDNGAGINALTSYLQAENLMHALGCSTATGIAVANCPNAYILQLKVVRAGGNNKTTRNLLKDVFTGPSISHSGGTIAQYNLYKVTGRSVSSKTLSVYSGYVRHQDIPH